MPYILPRVVSWYHIAMPKPTLYIFAGANGSGKTTIAKRLTAIFDVPFVNADEIAASLKDKSNIRAGKLFISTIKQLVAQNKSFAIESTLSGKSIAHHINEAKCAGFHVQIIYLYLNNPETNIERIKVRVSSGGHHVPKRDVLRRFYRSRQQFWNTYRLLCNDWILLYNPSDSLIVIAEGNSNTYTVYNEGLMNDFLECIDETK